MGSSFAGLNTALTGIYAARKGLDLTGQNVANANTEGYSRQQVRMDSLGAPSVPAIHSRYDGVGSGVTVAEVTRIRDAFLETRANTEHSRSAYLDTRSSILRGVEDITAEPGPNGLQAQMSEFWNSWHDVANRPGDSAARAQLMQRSGTLSDGLRLAENVTKTQWETRHEQLRHLTDEVNTTATAIADLNASIRRNTQAGLTSNELKDKRDLLTMKLSDMVGARTQPDEHGVMNVLVGSAALVRGDTAQKLQVTGGATFDAVRAVPPAPVALRWSDGGYNAAIDLGKAAGLLEGLNSVLPGNAARLDQVASALIDRVNTIHRTGYGLDGVTGRDFFTGTSARTIRLALTSNEQVGASTTATTSLDGKKAAEIGVLASITDGPDAMFRQMVVNVGVEAQTANRRLEIQNNITSQVDASRESQSGVDVDEEMVNMLTFQRAFEGASRALTALDQALDTLINRTGLVGR